METLDEATLGVLAPTVARTPGLIGVWELVPGETEVRHRGDWIVVDDVQAVPNGGAPTRQAWIRLAGGKTLLRPARALVPARRLDPGSAGS